MIGRLFFKSLLLIGLTLNIVAIVQCKLATESAFDYCVSRSGLKRTDIRQPHIRNANCAIDCETKQGTVLSYFVEDNTKCNDDVPGYFCQLGKCRNTNDPNPEALGLHELEIRIKSASVPDEDIYPTMGGSDVFVTVEIEKNGRPSYMDNDMVCHTYVIQDNNKPKWNFVCKPMPLSLSAELKFSAFDSDKPAEVSDYLGSVTENVEYLLNRGPKRLPLIKGGKTDPRYWIEVEVTGKEYNQSS